MAIPSQKRTFITSIADGSYQMAQPTDAVQPLRARLSADLLVAMKARDKATVNTLRCVLAVLDNAGAQDPKAFASSTEVPRKSLTQPEVHALMQTEVASRRTAITEYERARRHRDAERLRAELVVLSRYGAFCSGVARAPVPIPPDTVSDQHAVSKARPL